MNTHQIKTQPMDEEQLEKIKKGIIQVYLFLLGNFGPLPYAASD